MCCICSRAFLLLLNLLLSLFYQVIYLPPSVYTSSTPPFFKMQKKKCRVGASTFRLNNTKVKCYGAQENNSALSFAYHGTTAHSFWVFCFLSTLQINVCYRSWKKTHFNISLRHRCISSLTTSVYKLLLNLDICL